jgi:hypothetical protein
MIVIEYSKLGFPIPDYSAESFVATWIGNQLNVVVSTSNVFLAAKAMIARGDIKHTDICFKFKKQELYPDKNGRVLEAPEGFCDFESKWLLQLLQGNPT